MSQKIVKLTRQECFDASMVGVLRMIESLGLQDKHGAKNSTLQEKIGIQILGAMGEMVVAKHLGIFWSRSVNTFHNVADIQGGIEVRTVGKPSHRLMIRKDDNPNATFFLVVPSPRPPVFRIVGSILGRDGMRDEFIDNPNGSGEAWFVAQGALR